MACRKQASLLSVLVCLTLLSVSAQLSFFIIHSHGTALIDALISSSIPDNFFHRSILLPLLVFISVQIGAYCLFIAFIWFITCSCSEFFHLPRYGLGIFFWLTATLAIFILNAHYFPDSFFAGSFQPFSHKTPLLGLMVSVLMLATILSYYQLFRCKRRVVWGLFFLFLAALMLLASGVNYFLNQPSYPLTGVQTAKPNIILIGLDSLRPDYTGYFGKNSSHTPHIDQFLKTGIPFTEVYTPLARTFPAWVSILTAKYPKNSHARINLSYPGPVIANDTLAKRLQAANYETFYATDEKRFSNITAAYGFDHLIGPPMGLNDFILGGLSDFPLTNLLVNLPIGRFLFPYNYSNRAAAITYEPNHFLQLVQAGLKQRQGKPLFLALHFCVTHWPYTWANDHQPTSFTSSQRYQSSVEKVDQQLGQLLQILQDNGLLAHSLLILLSDHGTTFGLPGDRLLEQRHYRGDPMRLPWVTVNKLSASPDNLDVQHSYSLNTAYGQGTDVLSLKQTQVLLAWKYFGPETKQGPARFMRVPHSLAYRSSLLDIAPTILDFLQLPPMQAIDGQSLMPAISNTMTGPVASRPLYIETGYSISEIATDHIEVEKVLERTLHLFQVDPENGHLYVKPSAESAVLENKQRAILLGPWLLARYPASTRIQLNRSGNAFGYKTAVLPAYYIIANIRTGDWTIGFDSAFAKTAPLEKLQKQFNAFYGKEL